MEHGRQLPVTSLGCGVASDTCVTKCEMRCLAPKSCYFSMLRRDLRMEHANEGTRGTHLVNLLLSSCDDDGALSCHKHSLNCMYV